MISAMLYENRKWFLGQNAIRIQRRTDRAVARATRGMKLVVRKKSKDLMQLFGLEETMDLFTKASSVHWYGGGIGMTLKRIW